MFNIAATTTIKKHAQTNILVILSKNPPKLLNCAFVLDRKTFLVSCFLHLICTMKEAMVC